MQVRAQAREETGQRILATAQQLFGELLYDQVSLQAVAERAGVTVQTVLRRFTSKEQRFAAVTQWTSQQIRLVVFGRNNPSPYTVNGRPLYVHLNGLAIVLLK
jgi:AcrR family transcriptional regulator